MTLHVTLQSLHLLSIAILIYNNIIISTSLFTFLLPLLFLLVIIVVFISGSQSLGTMIFFVNQYLLMLSHLKTYNNYYHSQLNQFCG